MALFNASISYKIKEIPGMVPYFMVSQYDWGYKLKPRSNIAGVFKDRQISYPRGFNLGGSR